MKKILIVILAVSFAAGCGYSTRSLIPAGLQTINITIFENQTYEYQVETALANEIVNKFIIDGRLKVVNADEADTQLTGTIVEYCRKPLVYNNSDEVTQYQIQIFADVMFKDLKDGSIIYEGSRVSGEELYFVSGNLANTEEEARLKAFKDLAENIVEQVIEGW